MSSISAIPLKATKHVFISLSSQSFINSYIDCTRAKLAVQASALQWVTIYSLKTSFNAFLAIREYDT